MIRSRIFARLTNVTHKLMISVLSEYSQLCSFLVICAIQNNYVFLPVIDGFIILILVAFIAYKQPHSIGANLLVFMTL